MLKIFLPLLIIFSFPAFAADDDLVCDIRIDFGTHTVGIDAPLYTKIMARILANPSITEKHAENLGSKGERTICLMVKPEHLDDVYDNLREPIPDESKDFVTSIRARDGKHHMTHLPVKFQRNPYSK